MAFQKAILWSMLFEMLGLGCGSGPLTGRYLPPVGGFLYFLRPGTTKLPLFPALPLLGGVRRGVLDVALYAAHARRCSSAPSLARSPDRAHLLPLAVARRRCSASLDRTLFLARARRALLDDAGGLRARRPPLRSPAPKAVQLALWFWAGVSKLNHHFPAVVGVMTSNSPFTALRMAAPLDVPRLPRRPARPRGSPSCMAHAGTALELGVPVILARSATAAPSPLVGLVADAAAPRLHHQQRADGRAARVERDDGLRRASTCSGRTPPSALSALDAPRRSASSSSCAVALPLLGNLWPARVSFLLAMRYYAGNWAYSVWLFRGDSVRKLERADQARAVDLRPARAVLRPPHLRRRWSAR